IISGFQNRATTTNVNISWEFDQGGIEVTSPVKIPEGGDYDENFTLTLEMVQSSGKSNIPLYVGFVNCNKVLNTYDEASSLQLRLTNTNLPTAADPDITFHYDEDINLSSQLVVTLEVGTAADVPWALGTQDQVNNISISIPGEQWQQNGDIETIQVDGVVQGLQWTFIPQDADVVLAARKTMLINLGNIVTAHPTGEANLYLNYQYVPGYKDGQFVCQIEKAPLTFDDKVRVGTRQKLDGLLTVKNGISLDDPGDIQHEKGALNFGDTKRQMINLWQEAHGIGVQDSTTYLRTGTQFAWYKKGTHSDDQLSPGDGGTVLMVLTNASLDVNGRIKDKTGYVIPVGTIVPYAGSSAPEGWLICNGASLNQTEHQDLFDVIGTNYGGDGDNFNLPNLKGRVPVGKNDGTFSTLGKMGGEETHKLTTEEMPPHSHEVTDPGHIHNIAVRDGTAMGHVGTGNASQSATYGTNNSNTNITINSAGGISKDGESEVKPHNNLQPYLTINYIIKS
ncbi:tail fiber protein, partial [Moorena sp. SIO3B2]|uniref:phage tail protein n=1 Tax=Moorena sp. SIO3B2 TaxID=2607827 RepID=UPI0013CCB1C8